VICAGNRCAFVFVETGSTLGTEVANGGLTRTVNAELFKTQRLSIDLLQVHGDRLVVICTSLDLQGVVASQNFHAVKLRLFGDTSDLSQTLADFILDRLEIGIGVSAVRGLNSQLTDTLQVIVDFVQCTFSRLSDGDTIVSVTSCLGQTL